MLDAFPGWIDREAWEGFVEMRKAHKRPFTDRAKRMVLKELQRIKDSGHCPNEALDQSTLHGWLDVYPAKQKTIERVESVTTDVWKQDFERAKADSQTPEARAAAAKVRELFVRRA